MKHAANHVKEMGHQHLAQFHLEYIQFLDESNEWVSERPNFASDDWLLKAYEFMVNDLKSKGGLIYPKKLKVTRNLMPQKYFFWQVTLRTSTKICLIVPALMTIFQNRLNQKTL